MTDLTMGSLFDGIGGFPLAGLAFGIRTLWASEIEPFPIKVTKHWFPNLLHVGDITKLDGAALPPVDIICGGSPCQDLSVAGARAGLSGARSGLFLEQTRITKEMRYADILRGRTGIAVRPRWFLWENVPGHFQAERRKERTSALSWRRSQELIAVPYMYLDLTPGHGNLLGDFTWEIRSPWLGERLTLNTGVSPRGARESSLSQILEDSVPKKYYLTPTACLGILRRARERGKELPLRLRLALEIQAGVRKPTAEVMAMLRGNINAYHINQRKKANCREAAREAALGREGIDLGELSGALMATQNMQMQTFVAGFSAGAGASAGSIGYNESVAPTLKGGASGNSMPSVLCVGERAKVYENHGIDARYTGPYDVAPTVTARYGTGGNNTPLVQDDADCICIAGNAIDRQPQNGGNGIGWQRDISYTLTATDRHSVYVRQRVDQFKNDEVASTESARQHKDATDLVMDTVGQGELPLQLIRRLTPLECERLQGFPDGWTDLPGASDAARYKAFGNSVAIPCVMFLMQGIRYAVEHSKKEQ